MELDEPAELDGAAGAVVLPGGMEASVGLAGGMVASVGLAAVTGADAASRATVAAIGCDEEVRLHVSASALPIAPESVAAAT